MKAVPVFRHRRLGYATAALILLTALVPLGGELWAGGGGRCRSGTPWARTRL